MTLYFVTGTDTDVGKTYITGLLARFFLQKYHSKLGVVKPIQSGTPEDIKYIQKFAGLKPAQVYCPVKLKYPLAPQQAAELEKLPPLDPKIIIKKIKVFAKKHPFTLIEGSGGLFVPICYKYSMIDLCHDLKAKAIVVSRTGLGTINHTVLTIDALKQRHIPVSGVIYNTAKKAAAEDLSSKLNPFVISEMTGVRTLAVVNFGQQQLTELQLN